MTVTEEKQNPNRNENEFMLNLMVLRSSLARFAPGCRDRARRAGRYTWRDIRLMLTLVDKIQQAFLSTMPRKRLEYYLAYARHGHYEFRMDSVPAKPSRIILITDKHLGDICDAAMTNECALCTKEGRDIGRCKLREALMEVAPPSELQDGRWEKCEYQDAGSDLVMGRQVHL